MAMLFSAALLMPVPSQTQDVTAIVRLKDGEVAAGMMVDVGHRPAGSTGTFNLRGNLQANTDGKITFKLPTTGSHEVVVDMFEKSTGYSLPAEVFTARQTVTLPAKDLVFQCRGSANLKVEVRPGNELPKELKFQIEVSRERLNRRRAIRRREVTHKGGTVDFAGLHPAEYKVRLNAVDQREMEWHRTIKVGEGASETMVLPLPELLFGSVLGKVESEGGQTFSTVSVSISGRQSVLLDKQGRFVARAIPVGPVDVRVHRADFQGHAAVRVEAGKTSSAGVILAKRKIGPVRQKRELTGTLKFADGTPVVGAGLGRRPGGGVRLFHPMTKVDRDGKFEYDLDATAKFIRFGLHESEAWLKRSGRELQAGWSDPNEENFFLRVDKKDQPLTGVLPEPGQTYGRLAVVTKNFETERLLGIMLRVDLPNGQFITNLQRPNDGPVVVEVDDLKEPKAEKPYNDWFASFVPPGKRHIHIASMIPGLRAVSTRDSGNETITLDAADSGQVVLHLDKTSFERSFTIEGYDLPAPINWASGSNGYRTQARSGDQVSKLKQVYSWTGPPGWSRLADEPAPSEWGFPASTIRGDGSIVPPRLGVGRYRLQVRSPDQESAWLDFEVKRGQTIHFDSQASDTEITLKQRS